MGSDFIATLAENGKVHLSLSALVFCIIIPGREACLWVCEHGVAEVSKEELGRTQPRVSTWRSWGISGTTGKLRLRALACHSRPEYCILLSRGLSVWAIGSHCTNLVPSLLSNKDSNNVPTTRATRRKCAPWKAPIATWLHILSDSFNGNGKRLWNIRF